MFSRCRHWDVYTCVHRCLLSWFVWPVIRSRRGIACLLSDLLGTCVTCSSSGFVVYWSLQCIHSQGHPSPNSHDATLYHPLPFLCLFNGIRGYNPRKNFGIKDAHRRVLELFGHKNQHLHEAGFLTLCNLRISSKLATCISRSALASYRKVTTCRCLCCACRGCAISADNLCLQLQDEPASRPQGRVLGA